MKKSSIKSNYHLLSMAHRFIFTALVLLAATGSAWAQTVDATPTPTPTPQTNGNKKFIIRGGKGDTTPVTAVIPTPTPQRQNNTTQGSNTNPTSKNIVRTSAVLMPGIATRFKCPEPPLQVVLGNQTGIEVVEGVGETNDFFLLPSVAGITTNMFVQFASGTTEIKLTVNNGKAKNAAYDSEINLSVATSELLAKKNQELERNLKTLQDSLKAEQTARKTADDESKRKIEELQSQIIPPVDVMKVFRMFRGFQPRELNSGEYRLSMLTPLMITGNDRYSMVIEITNKDKKKPFSFKEVGFEGGEAKIVNGFAELKPGETQTVEIVLEMTGTNANLKLKLGGEKGVQMLPLIFAQ